MPAKKDSPSILFDKASWLTRAAERASRARSRNKLPARVRADLIEDQRAIDDLETLIDWLTGKGVHVSFSPTKHDGLFLQFGQFPKIMVNNLLLPKRQLFVLLHESGHWLVPKRLKVRFANGYAQAAQPHQTAKLTHRVDVLDEELEAWWQGRLLALKLKLASFDEEAYAVFKAKRIAGYCSWLTRSGAFKATPKIRKSRVDDKLPEQGRIPTQLVLMPQIGIGELDPLGTSVDPFTTGNDHPDVGPMLGQEGESTILQ